jgi:hypothetical protein
MIAYLAEPPAELIIASTVHGVTEHVAPLALNVLIVGVPLTVPAAQVPLPHVIAPLRIVPPPVSVGKTEALAASARQATAVIV